MQLGIDLEPFSEPKAKEHILREEIGASSEEILVGFVGRLTEIKNIPLLLEAAKIYKERKAGADLPRLKFVIVGDGHLRAGLEQEAENAGVSDIVLFLGNRNDTNVFYAGLDLVA